MTRNATGGKFSAAYLLFTKDVVRWAGGRAGTLRGITVTGDFVRSDANGRPGEGDRSIVWLYDAIKRHVVRACGLPVNLLAARWCSELHACVEAARPVEQADAWWAAVYSELPPDSALEQVLLARLDGQFVVGNELPPYLIRQLNRFGIPWLDLRIHPVRFLDDLLFAANASSAETQQALVQDSVAEDVVFAAAGLVEAMCRYTTDCTLPTGTLLVVGQRTMDSTQIIGGRFFDALENADAVATICADYPAALLKPHPYGGQHSLLLAAAAAPNAVGVTSDNLYRLLSQEQITAILTVNSSAAYEARYFDKRIHTLAPLPVGIAWRGQNGGSGHYASLDQQVFSTDFWRMVLAPHTPVSAPDGARLPHKPNRLRIAHDSFWNFQEIDSDRIPSGATAV